jgi:hypothetical protein
MNTKTSIHIHRTVAIITIAMMLFAALPVTPAGAVSANITSVSSGTWEATAWPSTQRSGTLSVTGGSSNVTGTGTAFLSELSQGNILRTTDNIQIGTVASIASDTALTLTNVPATTRTDIAYKAQGVGPADNVTIANGHTVTVAAKAINQTGTVTVNAGGTLAVSNSGAVFSTLSMNGTVNGTSGAALGAVTVNNGGLLTAGTNGNYTASSLTINSGGVANISRAFTVNGTTFIAGTITFSSTSVTSRAMVFKGSVNLNGGTWTEPTSGNGANNTYDFQGNFTNNASSFTTSGVTTHTFSGAGKTLSGGTDTAIARVKITGTYTNNGTLSVATLLSGTGSLTNAVGGMVNAGGTISIATLTNAGTLNKTDGGPITTALANFTNTGILNLNGTGTIAGITNSTGGTVNLTNSGSITAFDNATASSILNILDTSVPHFGILIVSVAGNTVNYGGGGDQVVKPITYNNLTFSGSGTKSITMTSGFTLANSTMSIAPTGTSVAGVTGQNLSVNHLSLGGAGQAPGTYGSTSSAATFKNNTYFLSTSTGYLNIINDARTPQTITFTSSAPTNATVGGPTYTPTATATSGLTVAFSIDTGSGSVCSINGAGVVSFTGLGTCVIDADAPGNATFLASSQQQSFDVKNTQTISFTSTAPASAAVDGPTYTPTATATSGLPVTFTIDVSAASVCSISAGVVSFDATGTCVINADQDGNDNFHAAPQVQQSFPVGKGAQTIVFTSTVPSNAVVGGATYSPTATATSGLPVTFAIDASASSVCSISAGVVSFIGVGTCVINGIQPGDANYVAAALKQQSFAVAPAPTGPDTTGVFRPINGLIFMKNKNETGFADIALNYGLPGDYPVVGDWDGNGTTTVGIYRGNTFFLRNENTIGFATIVFDFGQVGDQPIAGDWDGDGVDTIGVIRPSLSQFMLRNSNDAGPADMTFVLGNPGDVGIAGDWNGDGLDSTGVFRPSNGIIFLKDQNTTGFADYALNYGIPGDKPVMGDWNDDGIDTIGVYRDGLFYLRNENTIGFAEVIFGLGNPGDMPIAGNWDGVP